MTKEQIHQQCWRDRGIIVADSTVRQSLHRLRKNFQEVGIPQDVLVTHSKNMYFLSADIIDVLPQTETPDSVLPEEKANIEESNNIISTAPLVTEIRHRFNLLKILMMLTLILLFVVAGFAIRTAFLIHHIQFEEHTEKNGRHYLFKEDYNTNKDNAVWRAEFWIDYRLVPVAKSRYVYIITARYNVISMIICNNPLEDTQSTCQNFNIIGKEKK